ncbi:MAG: amino acid ABC transporter permease [Thermodesulfovibrionia bacterium]|nr:amino acid ABC transporter permease [Thermodesulfovibrionia bacterium]
MKFFNLRYDFDWSIPFREPYLSWLITGVKLTLLIAVVTAIMSLLIGTALAIMRVSRFKILNIPAKIYVETVRNIPGLFWLLFFYFIFPQMLPSRLTDMLNQYSYYSVVAGILGLTVDNSAYVSDIVRSGLLSVPRGHIEVAVSTGLNRLQQLRYIILPEAFRTILPPLGTRMIHNFKNSSLCMAIAAPELTWATQQIESITFRGLEVTFMATVFYVSLSLAMAMIIIRLEKRYKIT